MVVEIGGWFSGGGGRVLLLTNTGWEIMGDPFHFFFIELLDSGNQFFRWNWISKSVFDIIFIMGGKLSFGMIFGLVIVHWSISFNPFFHRSGFKILSFQIISRFWVEKKFGIYASEYIFWVAKLLIWLSLVHAWNSDSFFGQGGWTYLKSGFKGEFSVRSFYEVLQGYHNHEVCWKWRWNKLVSLRVSVFCWLAKLQKISNHG